MTAPTAPLSFVAIVRPPADHGIDFAIVPMHVDTPLTDLGEHSPGHKLQERIMADEHPKSENGAIPGVPKPAQRSADENGSYRATDTTGAGDPLAPGQGHPMTPRPADEED